ncbi:MULTISPECIES: hypothetical protein [Staphylococcus]|nr:MULTISPECIES: hypothetical protein [Staphylococcus]MCY1607588.1 hypothetical protein [Staphylococcus pettenkoferi]MCY6990966.1 hypothetical protein [Staphylococcus argensis]
MRRVAYSVETKFKAVKMKEEGYTTKESMYELNIKSAYQIYTW